MKRVFFVLAVVFFAASAFGQPSNFVSGTDFEYCMSIGSTTTPTNLQLVGGAFFLYDIDLGSFPETAAGSGTADIPAYGLGGNAWGSEFACKMHFFSPGFGPTQFQIVSFAIDPSSATLDPPTDMAVDIEVRNLGANPDTAVVIMEIKKLNGDPYIPPTIVNLPGLGTGIASYSFTVDDTAWEKGTYVVYASVEDTGGTLHDAAIRSFAVKDSFVPVPELGLFLVPLIAFAVLLSIVLSRKKN